MWGDWCDSLLRKQNNKKKNRHAKKINLENKYCDFTRTLVDSQQKEFIFSQVHFVEKATKSTTFFYVPIYLSWYNIYYLWPHLIYSL